MWGSPSGMISNRVCVDTSVGEEEAHEKENMIFLLLGNE